MDRSSAPSERVALEVKEILDQDKRARRRVTGPAVRSAGTRAVRGTRSVGRGASNLDSLVKTRFEEVPAIQHI